MHRSLMTTWCYVGAMGKKGDKNAVVDTKGRVFGAQRLRVIDASVFPELPPGHLLATVCKSLSLRRCILTAKGIRS